MTAAETMELHSPPLHSVACGFSQGLCHKLLKVVKNNNTSLTCTASGLGVYVDFFFFFFRVQGEGSTIVSRLRFFVCFLMEIGPRAPVALSLFLVHSGSVSVDDCGRSFLDELLVSSSL